MCIIAHIRVFYKPLKILCPSKNVFKDILHLSKMARRLSAKDKILEFSWPICSVGSFLAATTHSDLEPHPWESRKKLTRVLFFPLHFYNRNSFSKLPWNLKYTFFLLLCCCSSSFVLTNSGRQLVFILKTWKFQLDTALLSNHFLDTD